MLAGCLESPALMETLVRVVETGSFSGAAKQLRVGRPATSKCVKQLERRLGVRLLTHSTRDLMPTEAGQNFYERAAGPTRKPTKPISRPAAPERALSVSCASALP
jgi:Bacterial regulatory helix-turn-helix protein, lysR family